MAYAPVSKQEVKKLVGHTVYALKKDGSVVSGKLVKIKGNQLFLSNGKKASTKAILPLVLFDLLAIGTAPFAFGGFPYGYGGFGYPGFFW